VGLAVSGEGVGVGEPGEVNLFSGLSIFAQWIE
jgi:hypothetical protein